jgi:hypothetical protein
MSWTSLKAATSGCSKWPSNKAAAEVNTAGVPSGVR